MKSSHDVLKDPKLSSKPVVETTASAVKVKYYNNFVSKNPKYSYTLIMCWRVGVASASFGDVQDDRQRAVPCLWQIFIQEKLSGLYSKSTRVAQATNVCLWAPGKTSFFHISLWVEHPGLHG